MRRIGVAESESEMSRAASFVGKAGSGFTVFSARAKNPLRQQFQFVIDGARRIASGDYGL
jgi:hypothetical protein